MAILICSSPRAHLAPTDLGGESDADAQARSTPGLVRKMPST